MKIQVRLDHTDMPTAEELAVRKQIEDRILDERVGRIKESAAGAGHYDLTVEVDSTNDAVPKIRAILRDAGVMDRATVRVVAGAS